MSKLDMISYDSGLQNRMQQCKQECLDALAGIVHPDYINKFAGVLSYAYEQDDIDAHNIASELNLNHLNFLAVLDLEKDFENALFEQQEREYLESMTFEEIAL